MQMKDSEEILKMLNNDMFLRKTAKILMNIQDMDNVVDVKEKSDTSYSYCATKIKEFKNMGIINTVESGRTTKIVMTEKGKKMKDNILNIREVVNGLIKEFEAKIEKEAELEEKEG